MEILEGKKNKELSEEKIEENSEVDVKNLENSEEEKENLSPDDMKVQSENSEETENDEMSKKVEDDNKRFIDLSKDDE